MRKSSHLRGLLLSVFILLLAVGAVVYRQNLIDWWQLRNYSPPAEVVKLADQGTVTPYGRKIFYVTRPAIESSQAFNQHCNKKAEKTIVLGCYDGRHIYVFNVTDDRLSGVKQVTAMHEMLHAAYDRLSKNEKDQVDVMLEEQLAKIKDDEHINELVAQYRKSEPGEIDNELHSILGTEVRSLTPELETYYSKYFQNRKAVVAFAEQYEGVFKQSQKEISAIDERLSGLKEQIEANKMGLDSDYAALKTESEQMEQLRQAGETQAYNERVPDFNAKVQAYNAKSAATKQLIAQYNELVATRNQKEAAHNNLADSLNSNLKTAPTQN